MLHYAGLYILFPGRGKGNGGREEEDGEAKERKRDARLMAD